MKTLLRAVALILFWPLSAMVSHAFTVTNFSTSNYNYYWDGRNNAVDFDLTMTVNPYGGGNPMINLDECSTSDEFILGLMGFTFNPAVGGQGHHLQAWGPVERPDPTALTLRVHDVARKIGLPPSFTTTMRLTGGIAGDHFELTLVLANIRDWENFGGVCRTTARMPIDLPEIPDVPPSCSASVVSHIAHGDVMLPRILDEHRAQGRVSVSCSSPALVTLTTGHTGTRVINSDLATEILIEGVSNSATKTISTSDSFNVISRLHRTDDTAWSGSFNHSVPLTISWP